METRNHLQNTSENDVLTPEQIKYKRYISERRAWSIKSNANESIARRKRANAVINAYTTINDLFFLNISFSLEIQNPNDARRDMTDLGYAAATIWFFEKSIEEIMEIFELLEGPFAEAIINAPSEEYVFLDFKTDLFKLSGLFDVAQAHVGDEIQYGDEENFDYIQGNLESIKEGMIHYIQQIIMTKHLEA